MSRLLLNTTMYNRDLVPVCGVIGAIYLSTLIYNYREWTTPDGWMLLRVEQIQNITGLNAAEQQAARTTLHNKGVLREGMAFDEPAMCLDMAKLDSLLIEASK